VQWIDADQLDEGPDVDGFGSALVARDFNGDGYSDVAVGAPGSPKQRKDWDLGSITILFGGRNGLRATDTTLIPAAEHEPGFASRLAAGDVDRDG
jgi:hypothetical protein